MSEPVVAVDLDGTLVDAAPRQIAVAQEAARIVGSREIDGEMFWSYKREGATTLEALRRLGVENSAALEIDAHWREQIEAPRWLQLDAPLSGARDAVLAIRADGFAPLVLTARGSAEGALERVAALQIAGLPCVVVSPTAAVAEKAAALTAHAACGFIGDSETDGEASRRAKIPFVAVNTGQRSRAFLDGLGFEVADGLVEAWVRLRAALGLAHQAG